MDKSRFSMLLLEPGEIYFEDFSCSVSESESVGNGPAAGAAGAAGAGAGAEGARAQHGRLKLCSKSLVFEPRDWNYPLIKMQFKDCAEISIVKQECYDSNNVIKVKMKQIAEMLAENILAPYKFVYEERLYYVLFDFASAEECLSQMQQLQRASTLHAPEHDSMVATILHSRYMRMVFDPVMMDDFSEEIVCELQAEKISPLVRLQGKLALTHTTLYFQPFSNVEGSAILKLRLCNLERMFKRRFLLRQVGLELYGAGAGAESAGGGEVSHLYLTFQCEADRDRLHRALQAAPRLQRARPDAMTLQWQNGVVSNYDYLMHLNCLADRSKNDLTQYPVFPWVVADYSSEALDLGRAETFRDLSRPVGALSPDRLERLLERYHEMSEPKFLYGSHYSAPGLVLFYLVRKYPQYMLCLQNGRFDHPDRMFNCVRHVYGNCLRNMSDFKELVPEFYDTDAKGDFLVNKYEIDFGERHDGRRVDGVALPAWAHARAGAGAGAAPEAFVRGLRDALESEHVSRHLHLWIDLIFGYKQRGEEAVRAHNVFHHVCYEGAVDLQRVGDMHDRHALEVQIMEFGQVPKQLFTRPHVRRIPPSPRAPALAPPPPWPEGVGEVGEGRAGPPYSLRCADTIALHREGVTCAARRGGRVVSVGRDGTLKVYDVALRKQIRSVILCATPLSSCACLGGGLVACASWDNNIYLYDVEYGRVVEDFLAHDAAVCCLLWVPEEQVLVSGGADGVARVWAGAALRGGGGGRGGGRAGRGLRAELDHGARVCALTYRRRKTELDIITCTSEGEVFLWALPSGARLQPGAGAGPVAVTSRGGGAGGGPVAAARLLPPDRLLAVSARGLITVTDLAAMHCVYQKQLPSAVRSACWAGGALWLGGGGAGAGGAAGEGEGALLQWDMRAVAPLSETHAHEDEITSIDYDEETNTLVTASMDKTVKLWQLTGS